MQSRANAFGASSTRHEILPVDDDEKSHSKSHLPSKAAFSRTTHTRLRNFSFFCLVLLSALLLQTSEFNFSFASIPPTPPKTVKLVSDITTGSRADWGDKLPTFCEKLFDNPKPQEYACKRDPVNLSCTDTGDTIMFSQFKQDYYLYTQHFVHLNRPGVYLDVAANDPFHYSNSYFMDRCLKWRGICVEGNPAYHEKLFRHRSCMLVPTCVGAKDGEHVAFGLNGGSGGIIGSTYKNAEILAKQNKTVATISERCTTMKDVLKRTNVTKVDYLSLDVEGHEVNVLNGFDWDNVKINVISVETSKETLQPITDMLTARGYVKHHPQLDERSIRSGMIHEDAIFLHNDVTWGSPL